MAGVTAHVVESEHPQLTLSLQKSAAWNMEHSVLILPLPIAGYLVSRYLC